jgi:hypothetical protein
MNMQQRGHPDGMNMQQRGGPGNMNMQQRGSPGDMQQRGGPGIGSGAMWTTLPCFLSHSVLTSSSISTPSIWHVQPIDAHTHVCLELIFESSVAWGSRKCYIIRIGSP